MLYLFFFTLLLFSSSYLDSATKPPPQVIPPGLHYSAPPVVYPSAPGFAPLPLRPSGGGSSGNFIPKYRPVEINPSPVFTSKPIPYKTTESLVTPRKVSPVLLLLTRRRSGYRSANAVKIPVAFGVSANAEQILSLQTAEREAQNDAIIAKHEHENDLMVYEANKELFQQVEALYKKNVLGKQAYEESLTAMEKMRWRSEFSKNRMEEFLTEIIIDGLKIKKAQGTTVPALDFAKAYLKLWEARFAKSKAIEGEAQVDANYSSLVYQMALDLRKKTAVPESEVIRAKKEADQDAVILKAAHEVVEQNSKNLKEAEQTVKDLENPPTPPTPLNKI